MKRYLLAISYYLFASFAIAHAQSVEEILRLVEQNNPTLRAAAAKTAEEKEAAKAGAALDDPEIGFDYLWGNKGVMGKRKDVNISQEFNLATVFGYRRRLAKSQQELLDLQLSQQKLETRLQTLELLAEIVYNNKALALYNERLAQERQLANAYEKRLAAGDANKIETNRARLSLAEVEAEAAQVLANRDLLLIDLQTMCGEKVDYTETVYPAVANDVSLKSLNSQVASLNSQVAEQDLKATKVQSLPSIKAGYMAELTDEEKWRGVTFGVSVPLWSSKKEIRRAKLGVETARTEAEEAAAQLENIAAAQQLRTERLRAISEKMYEKLAVASSAELLKKALDEGEISLIEYTLEIKDLFELKLKALEAERDYQQAWIKFRII